jgi:hypothetical protein
MQAVERVEPQVREQPIGWVREQHLAGRLKVRTRRDLSDGSQRSLQSTERRPIRVSEQYTGNVRPHWADTSGVFPRRRIVTAQARRLSGWGEKAERQCLHLRYIDVKAGPLARLRTRLHPPVKRSESRRDRRRADYVSQATAACS